jgi:hypothetical protein
LCAAPSKLEEDAPRSLLRGFRRENRFERRYRVDATVLLLGIPVFSRQGVGSGYAATETGRSGSATALALQFAAGSWPERCHGLNRFGVMQEIHVERSGGAEAMAFVGLITPSKEDDLDGAKKALRPPEGTMDVTVARGSTSEGRMRFRVGNATVPAHSDWTALAEMLDRVSAPPDTAPRETPLGGSTTFMQAMRWAALSGDTSFRCGFMHNGKQFLLETRRKLGAACEMSGVIRTNRGAKSAEFRTSYAAGDQGGLPIRIEYHPKSYLRLIFNSDGDATEFPIPTLFPEEAL